MVSIMETLRLKQFKAVVDAGGLLKASELLHISGGGLSKSLKVLEHELGATLFLQKGRGLELSDQGRALYERIPAILRAVDELTHLQVGASGTENILRIVSFEVFTTYFLSQIFATQFPGFVAEIREAYPGRMETLIAARDSDFGITYTPVPHAGIDFVKVGRIRMGLYGLDEKWSGVEFTRLPFVTPIFPVDSMPSGVRGLDGWPDHTQPRTVAFRVEMMETAIQLCLRGVAVAFIPDIVATQVNLQNLKKFQLQELPLPRGMKPVYRDIYLLYRRTYVEDKTMRLLAKAIRRLR
jgi:DNA-binding transcriptional LysR family regulator